jgi:Tol biopolymer transport system component
MHKLAIALGFAALVIAAVSATSSNATFGGRNGRLAYQVQVGKRTQLFTVRPDGTGTRQVTHLTDSDAVGPSWSRDGRRIVFARDYLRGPSKEHLDIVTIDADGRHLRAMGLKGMNGYPTWSPDGRQILFTHPGGFGTVDAAGGEPRWSSYGPHPLNGDVLSPTFSPDGRRIAFWRPEHGGASLYVLGSDGTGLQRIKAFPKGIADKIDWSPDGSRIAFSAPEFGRPGLSANVYTIRPDGTGLIQLTHDRGGKLNNGLDSWSPDGTRIAFVSNRSGTYEIYGMSSSTGSGVNQITKGPEAHFAAWGTHP